MSISLRDSILVACVLASSVSAQTLVRSVNGPAAGAKFGKPSIVVPDQNGDGYKDLLVGAPGFNAGRGAIYCMSGAHLALGTGAPTLWSLAPTANPGDMFGHALTNLGDVTGDSVHDFLVGQPGYDTTTANDVGAVRLVNGASRTAVSLIHGAVASGSLGMAVAAYGDSDGDGRSEVAIGAPGSVASDNRVFMLGGAAVASNGPISSFVPVYYTSSAFIELGASIASGFDVDGDGLQEIVVGAPGADGPGLTNSGSAYLFKPLPSGAFIVRAYHSSINGERLGASVDGRGDFDGDGAADIVVGAPNSSNGSAFEVGRAVVLSGARVLSQTPPYEIYALPYGGVTPPTNHTDPQPDFHFGAAVRACADLNNDGVGEVLVGAPDYFTQSFSGWNFRGAVRVYSGATGEQLTGFTGAPTDRLGDGFAGAIDDFDGDGFEEFVVAGSSSDVGGVDSGVLKCYRLFPIASSTYCTGKINSLGCTPAVSFSGVPSMSSGLAFTISGANFVNQKNGLLFYSHRPTAVLFQGGTKCVADPVVRTMSMNSGGASTGASCTGVYSFDFNDWIQTSWDGSIVAGAEIYAQYWARDPQSASQTSLSNAVHFVVHP